MKLSKLLDKTFWKFILVGIVNTLFGTAVMFLSYNLLHFSYWISSALNYILGSILSYFLNKNFTFRNKEKGWRVIVRFVLNISVCYLLAYGLAKPLVLWFLSGHAIHMQESLGTLLHMGATQVQENIAMVVGMCLVVLLNYIGQRLFDFAPKKEEQGRPSTEEPPAEY